MNNNTNNVSNVSNLIKVIDEILAVSDPKLPETMVIQTIARYIANIENPRIKKIILQEGIKKVDNYRKNKVKDLNIVIVIDKTKFVEDKFLLLNGMLKTRMCKYNDMGYCRNGKNCTFAHSVREMVIKPCRYNGTCKNKEFCKFSH